MTPEVSIIIPTYNQFHSCLDEAMRSAFVQKHSEIVLVDDGSDMDIAVVWEGATNIRHETNRGISAALNTGIEAARGEWICWLPSDDLFMPNKVEVQLADLKESGLKAGFHGWYAFKDNPAQPYGKSQGWNWSSHKHQRQQLANGCSINGLTVMIHRSVFDDVGLFDTTFKYGQDWEMWCRIVQKYEWRCTPQFLALRRESGENLTERIRQNDEMRVVRDAEDQRIRDMYPWPPRS